MKNLTDFREKRAIRAADYGIENAFAKILRREFPAEGRFKAIERRFKVTASEARALDNATASKKTLNTILRNPRNFGLWLECSCDVAGITLEEHLNELAKGAADERAKWEAKERHLEGLEARWRARVSDAGGDAR